MDNTVAVMTVNQYNKKHIEANRVLVSGNIDTSKQTEIIENHILKKAKEGSQVVVVDAYNKYQNSLKERIHEMGIETYAIDPYDHFKDSDSIDIMSVLKNEPELYEAYMKLSMWVLPHGEWLEIAYSYYTETTLPENYNFADFIDVANSFNKLTYKQLTDSKNLPNTSALYLSKYYQELGNCHVNPAKIDSWSNMIHQYIVEQVRDNTVRKIPGSLEAAKEVFGGKRRNIDLTKEQNLNRVIFLNTTCGYTDIVVSLLIALFAHIEPSTVIVADGTLNFNKKLIRIPDSCQHFLVSNYGFAVPAELFVVPEATKQDAEERYLYLSKGNSINIPYVLSTLFNNALWAFFMASSVLCLSIVFSNIFITADAEVQLSQLLSFGAHIYLAVYLVLFTIANFVSVIRRDSV